METSTKLAPNICKIGSKLKVVILTVYVDDFILAGPGSSDEWPSIRNEINGIRPTVPSDVGRLLGVRYTFTRACTTIEIQIYMN